MFTRALPEVSNSKKLYASKEDTGRIKVFVLFEWEEDQYPKTKFVPQQEKYDPTSFKGTQAQDDLPPQDHKQKGKDKLQEEIDAFEEAPKALVKWVPKTTSSSTSSSTTTTPRIPIKMMWIQKKKN